MMRWTTVSALLLLVGGATFGAWHLLLPSGAVSDDDAYAATSTDAAPEPERASPEAAMAVRSSGNTAGGAGPEAPEPGGALVARWQTEAARRRAETERVVERLEKTQSWTEARKRYEGLRRAGKPEHNLRLLQELFADATEPMTRQNLIFLAVLTLPSAVSHPWLHALREGSDAGDAEDALVALAFDGEPASVADFVALATTPSPAPVRRLWEGGERGYAKILAAGPEGARSILRSYRAIEVLDRKPYFKVRRHPRPATWTAHPYAGDTRLARRLEEGWLARYEGHPGSDDIAWRIGRKWSAAGDHLEACRWYSRASVLPDQDVTYYALSDLLLSCELLLAPEDVWRIAPRADDPNFDLLDYVAMRRVAAARGFEAAVAHAQMRAASAPGSLVGHAWLARRSHAAPYGVDRGERRLAPDDPLLRSGPWLPRPARPDPFARTLSASYWRTRYQSEDDASRLTPPALALAPSTRHVIAQLRAWETMAELARREQDARGTARADLVYKQAAIAYHEPMLLFPRWDWPGRSFGREMQARSLRKVLAVPEEIDRAREQFARESYAPYLAIRLFERLEREHPDYPGMDKVIYSRGMAWKKLIDFQPFDSAGSSYPWASAKDNMDGAVRSLVAAFEHLAASHPDSTLTDDALAAVAYWRRERPGAFGR